jgi:hypothetical protein
MGLAARAAALSTWLWEFDRDPPAGRDTPLAADRDGVDKAASEALARDQELSVEYRVQRPDGGVRWLMAYGRADRSGEAGGCSASRATSRAQGGGAGRRAGPPRCAT